MTGSRTAGVELGQGKVDDHGMKSPLSLSWKKDHRAPPILQMGAVL